MPGFIHRLFGRDDLQEKTKLDGGKNIKRGTVYHTRFITFRIAVPSCCKLNPFYFCMYIWKGRHERIDDIASVHKRLSSSSQLSELDHVNSLTTYI